MTEFTTIITQLIGNLGFPIACVVVMFHMWNKEREEHREESIKWIEALNRNSDIISKLSDRLDGIAKS